MVIIIALKAQLCNNINDKHNYVMKKNDLISLEVNNEQ